MSDRRRLVQDLAHDHHGDLAKTLLRVLVFTSGAVWVKEYWDTSDVEKATEVAGVSALVGVWTAYFIHALFTSPRFWKFWLGNGGGESENKVHH